LNEFEDGIATTDEKAVPRTMSCERQSSIACAGDQPPWPLMADGTAGTPTVFVASDCANLSGADGLTVDPDGAFVVAINHLNKPVRISAAAQVTTLLEDLPLDFPTTTVFVGRTLYVDNFSFLDALRPGLIRVQGY
jgi:sugar lactone lactonase YvrE